MGGWGPRGGASLRGGYVFQTPKEEKIEDKGHSGLTTLFPGQKRRISHLAKQGKEVSICFWVLSRGRQERRGLCVQKPDPRVSTGQGG